MKFILLIPVLLLFGVSLQSYASYSYPVSSSGDKKVNCTESVVSTPYYYGATSCFSLPHGRWLYDNVSHSPVQWVTLTEWYWNGNAHVAARCDAFLPNTGYDQSVVEKCEYTPRAIIRKHYIEESYDSRTDTTFYQAGIAVAAFEYSDRDGHITQVEKWVDGVSVDDHHIDVYEPTHIRLRVTDNHGHMTETSSTISPPLTQVCMRGGMLILCEEVW